MKVIKYFNLTICMLLLGCNPFKTTKVVPITGNRTVNVTVAGISHTLDAEKGYFWSDPIYNMDQTVAYVKKNQQYDSTASSPESIVKVEKSGVVMEVPLPIAMGSILEIYSVSDDGKRLLVQLHFVKKKTNNATFFGTRPVILDAATGEITEVKF